MNSLRVLLDRGGRWRLLLLLLATLFAVLLEMVGIGAVPALVALWADPERVFALLPDAAALNAIRRLDGPSLTLLSAGILVGLFVVKNAYAAVLMYVESAMLRDLSVRLAGRLFRGYLRSPYAVHLQRNSAQLIRNISTEVTEAVRLLRNAMALVREGLVLTLTLLLLLLVDPLVSLSMFVLLAAAAAVFHLTVGAALTRRGQLAQDTRASQVQAIQQGLGAMKEAKILGREDHLVQAFDVETAAREHQEMYQQIVSGLPRLFLEVIAVVAVLMIAVVFVLLERPVQAMLPVLGLLAVAVVRIVPALNSITSAIARIRYQRPALDLVCRELESLERDVPEETGVADDTGLEVRHAVTMHDVHFRYPGERNAALENVSCRIGTGEAVAFIGPSGAGKSTLIDIILGVLMPISGEVRVDGRNIQEFLRAWQRQIGYVPQDIYLLDDTIRRNVALGLADSEIDNEAIARALSAARLEQFITDLPAGLNTLVGDRGVRLSGGQRQRIGIARALYHDPAVLVLDEATSALDDETEREVIAAIATLRGDRTIITIAHRLSTVAGCDRLYLLENGSVVDQGTWRELASRHEQLRLPIWSHPETPGSDGALTFDAAGAPIRGTS